jgi:hypothetical protein
VGMMRIFAPFSKSFFVPWNEMSVIPKDRLSWSGRGRSVLRGCYDHCCHRRDVLRTKLHGLPDPKGFGRPLIVKIGGRRINQGLHCGGQRVKFH